MVHFSHLEIKQEHGLEIRVGIFTGELHLFRSSVWRMGTQITHRPACRQLPAWLIDLNLLFVSPSPGHVEPAANAHRTLSHGSVCWTLPLGPPGKTRPRSPLCGFWLCRSAARLAWIPPRLPAQTHELTLDMVMWTPCLQTAAKQHETSLISSFYSLVSKHTFGVNWFSLKLHIEPENKNRCWKASRSHSKTLLSCSEGFLIFWGLKLKDANLISLSLIPLSQHIYPQAGNVLAVWMGIRWDWLKSVR